MDWELAVAFLSGVGAVLSSALGVHLARRRADEECERRLAAFREGLEEGRR